MRKWFACSLILLLASLATRLMFEQEPYREYQRYFNVHRIDVVSAQPGADHPERGSFVNTALGAA